MKAQAAVFHLPPSCWNVLDAYLDSGHHALSVGDEAPAAPEISRHGGRCRALSSLIPEAEMHAVEESWRPVLQRSPYLFTGKEWDALCARHGMSPDVMRQAMRQDLAEDFAAAARLVERLERAAQTFSIPAVVVPEEWSAESRTLGDWARQRGIPVLHLYDGLAMDGDYPDAAGLRADAVTSAGPRHAESLEDSGLPAGRILQAGNPGWTKYSELAGMKEVCRRGLAKLFGWGEGPLFVFGTGSAPIASAAAEAEVLEPCAKAFFACAREIGAAKPSSLWTVLLRKSDPPGLEKILSDWASAEGVPKGRIRFFRNDPELFIASAVAVVSIDSSLTAEALLAGTPAINLLTDSGWRTGPAFAADTGVREVPPEELRAELLRAMAMPAADPGAQEAARSVFHPAALGDPVRNVVQWIASQAAPG